MASVYSRKYVWHLGDSDEYTTGKAMITPEKKLPSTQECLDILKRAEESRKKCCDRLIELKMLKDDAWQSGEFDKVWNDCYEGVTQT